MLLDFHSHIPTPNSVFCTDRPFEENEAIPTSQAILVCEGLLPDKWTQDRHVRLFRNLTLTPERQLGEVGLDRRHIAAMNMEMQLEALRLNLDFALDRNKSVTLHCVQETGRMLALLSEPRYRKLRILWHGFTGSEETARELSELGVIISIGPRFKGDIARLFKANNALVLETDYEGGNLVQYFQILQSHYAGCAKALGMTMESLSGYCMEQFYAFTDH